MKPIWLLDVDGVINKINWPQPGDSTGIADSFGSSFNITWRQGVVDFITGVHLSGDAEVQWCSTWCQDAPAMESCLQMPELPLAFDIEGENYYSIKSAKRRAAASVIEAGIPLIWTDDEAIPYEFPRLDNVLIIEPDPYYGLTDIHLTRIASFIKEQNDR